MDGGYSAGFLADFITTFSSEPPVSGGGTAGKIALAAFIYEDDEEESK